MSEQPLKYGIVPVEQWHHLEPIFESQGAPLPDVNMATAAIAVDPETEGIVGMLMLQVVYHSEPLWIAPEYRGRVDFRRLLELIDKLNPETYYVFSRNETTQGMAKLAGLEQLDYVVYRKKPQ